jgi:putative NIF3 family GTP cyclohydrolase 1 type 2
MRGNRIKKLIQNDISLVAYHLPLDAHPALGNNAAIAELLGLHEIEALDSNERHPIGNIGYLKKSSLLKNLKINYNRSLILISFI